MIRAAPSLWALALLACGPAPPPQYDLGSCGSPDGGIVGDAGARPLAIVGDRVSDRLELYAVEPALAPAACMSVDENPGFIDEPFDVAVAPAGDVMYVVLGHADGYQMGTLEKIRLVDGARLGSVVLGQEPSMIALSSDGARAYVSLFRNLAHPRGPWTDPGALVAVDTDRMQVLGEAEVCAAALGVALDEPRARVWVACLGATDVALVDVSGAPSLERTVTLDDGAGPAVAPAYVALDGQHAFVTAQGSGELWILDQADGADPRRIALGSDSFPQRLAQVPGRQLLLVAIDGASQLGVVATDALLVVDRVDVAPHHPQGIAVTRDARWAVFSDEADLMSPGQVVRVDLADLLAGQATIDGIAQAGVFPQAVTLVE